MSQAHQVFLSITGFTIMLWVTSCPVMAKNTATYDIAILNGRVMDPQSGLDAVRNIGIQAGACGIPLNYWLSSKRCKSAAWT